MPGPQDFGMVPSNPQPSATALAWVTNDDKLRCVYVADESSQKCDCELDDEESLREHYAGEHVALDQERDTFPVLLCERCRVKVGDGGLCAKHKEPGEKWEFFSFLFYHESM